MDRLSIDLARCMAGGDDRPGADSRDDGRAAAAAGLRAWPPFTRPPARAGSSGPSCPTRIPEPLPSLRGHQPRQVRRPGGDRHRRVGARHHRAGHRAPALLLERAELHPAAARAAPLRARQRRPGRDRRPARPPRHGADPGQRHLQVGDHGRVHGRVSGDQAAAGGDRRAAGRSRSTWSSPPTRRAARCARSATRWACPCSTWPPGVGGRFSVLSPVGLLPAALTGMDVAGAAGRRRGHGRMDQGDRRLGQPGLRLRRGAVPERRGVRPAHQRDDALLGPPARHRRLVPAAVGGEPGQDRRPAGPHGQRGPDPGQGPGRHRPALAAAALRRGPGRQDHHLPGRGRVRADHARSRRPGPEAEALAYLGGHTLAELLWAEQKSTAWALAQKGRPSLTITLPKVDARSVGALIYLLEMATAVAGELYDIDAFDQPGVELSKKATYALMGRDGYEDLAGQIE